MGTSTERQRKIAEYERFVEERLKVDLQHAIDERQKILDAMKVYVDLAKSIEALRAAPGGAGRRARALVDLGSQVFVQADVPDTSRVFVDVGLGFHVECTWTEALDFCTQKEEAFTQRVEKRTKEIADIKAQIKLVVEGVRELMSLPPEPERRAALQ